MRDYFTLTSRERKGALMLAGIIIIQIMCIIRLHYLNDPAAPAITRYAMQLNAFDKKTAGKWPLKFEPAPQQPAPVKSAAILQELHPFDPNTISDEQWIEFGLSQKQTAVIRNYLRKGGRFRNKESFSKMYCISPGLYARLEPYIEISKSKTAVVPSINPHVPHKKDTKVIELNGADTSLLTELPLVGAGRARLIYRYRERLGGFADLTQLLEVYTIDSSVYMAIIPFCTVDAGKIRKININSDSLYHPYLSKQTVSILMAYRKHHGNFNDINDLRKAALPDEQLWRKLVPYMAFE